MIDVAVNGYGVIGKRVAYAVSLQDDMHLVGIAKQKPDYKAVLAAKSGIDIYCSGKPEDFQKKGMKIKGSVEDMLNACDLVVDATPEEIGGANKPLYEKAGVKAIWQGGEEHELTGLSFNAYANYQKAIGAKFARVVSCNTTGLIRSLFPLHKEIGVKRVKAVLVRRAADPAETKKGPINALEPETEIPSHHALDVQTVMPDIDIETVAIKAPTTLMHLHYVDVELSKNVTKQEVIGAWRRYRRVTILSASDGIKGTAQVMDFARDMARGSGDMYEIVIWDGMNVKDNRVSYFQAVHQEADVVPENVDAIRAMCEIEKDGNVSINKTDRSLKIGV